jgi:hypothetical protein
MTKMRRVENYMKLFIPALSINEGLSRNAVASFVAGLNPTLDELSDTILIATVLLPSHQQKH